MDAIDIDELCADVSKAVGDIRMGFRSNIDTAEVLDRFWCLQDQISRLVESAVDRRQETLHLLKQRHPRLIQNVIDVLSFAEKLHITDRSAIAAATFAINRSLEKLEYLREQANVAAARV